MPRDHATTWGEGADGACFAVIRERWKQFLFGFYPRDRVLAPDAGLLLSSSRWRRSCSPSCRASCSGSRRLPPLLLLAALGRLDLGAAHRLRRLRRRLAFVARSSPRADPVLLALIAAVVAPLLWWLYRRPRSRGRSPLSLPDRPPPVASKHFGGFMLSMTIGMTGIAFSLPLGILLALGRRSDMLHRQVDLRRLHRVHPRRAADHPAARGAASCSTSSCRRGTNFDIILRVIIMVTLFSAAYMAEVIRGGLAAAAPRPVRGRRRARPRLLAVDAARSSCRRR